MDLFSAHRLAHESLNKLSAYKELQKKNHHKHSSFLKPEAKILCPNAYLGLEPIALSVINKEWDILVVEPQKEALFAAIRRVEALDLEGRIRFEASPLAQWQEQGFDAALTSLTPNLLEPQEQEAYFQAIFSRLKPGGRLTLVGIFEDPAALAAWKEAQPQLTAEIELLLKLAPPLSKEKVLAWAEGFGAKESWTWGKSFLVESLHFKKNL
ncbi:MAG: hypothetical protein A2600_13625 [Candidatus Lambdaproteobacteria bacterium RIFOXYD1_FULL_56_27]|uniref:Methyltransferase domain-containing protein n=1 Tax=Candidatus Lambdaproteobacteria bacterium RIFOXYD2_FULL_56_26 TaxID=1817773 RepID=A0A1F6GU66_9PROT|nr:MAG: hypothetical protein A2426_02220 [Candidatus Lambdaproteobacteria bacterium RIFOXYC1_FULL_56_13]OGH01540.1 MAG: hypothetical protein A2557_14000 [Candidatus Lambdaproteobacteria bacterium RIFOXYD2_FULL_56_26]OGH06761.1 MAG: hypothetical protein A2600_13625 [Candidatus Lambdaproteobacteria bacterium RIFOXYD1_FULL_56_27]